jgi:hypothetical protein
MLPSVVDEDEEDAPDDLGVMDAAASMRQVFKMARQLSSAITGFLAPRNSKVAALHTHAQIVPVRKKVYAAYTSVNAHQAGQ